MFEKRHSIDLLTSNENPNIIHASFPQYPNIIHASFSQYPNIIHASFSQYQHITSSISLPKVKI